MLFLFIFGNHVNDKMGQLGYLAFYLAGGDRRRRRLRLGDRAARGTRPSGPAARSPAVTGAYLILFPRSHITVVWWFMLIGRFEIQSLWFVLFFFAQDIFLSAAGQDNVAHAAHIGGTVFGAAVCFSLVVVHLLPRDQFDVWALIQRWNKRRQYRDLVAKGYNPFDYTAAEPTGRGRRAAPDPAAERVLELRAEVNEALAQKRAADAARLYVRLREADPDPGPLPAEPDRRRRPTAPRRPPRRRRRRLRGPARGLPDRRAPGADRARPRRPLRPLRQAVRPGPHPPAKGRRPPPRRPRARPGQGRVGRRRGRTGRRPRGRDLPVRTRHRTPRSRARRVLPK